MAVAKTVRLEERFEERVSRYADNLGLSFNALVIVALNEYLRKDGQEVQAVSVSQQSSSKKTKRGKR
jgi:hypothetical protein